MISDRLLKDLEPHLKEADELWVAIQHRLLLMDDALHVHNYSTSSSARDNA